VNLFNCVSVLQWKVSNHEVSLLCTVLHREAFVALKETGRIKPVYEVVRCLQNKCISLLKHVLTNSFLQSMIAQLVLNLLKSRDTIAMLQ